MSEENRLDITLADALLMAEPVPYVRILRELAEAEPDRIAVKCGHDVVTRKQLDAESNRVAWTYKELGVAYGDYVSIGLPNSIEFIRSVIATWKLGAIPQPLSPALPISERQAIIELANAALVVGADSSDHPGYVCLPAGFSHADARRDDPLPEVVSPAWKAPTSGGSTGRPKLIVAGTPAEGSPALLSRIFLMESGDRHLVPGPLYHNAPFTMTAIGLLLGQEIVLMPRFEAHAALATIQAERVTFLQLVPTMMSRMLRVIESSSDTFDVSSIRALWHMASACPPWLKQAWIELIGPERVLELYGGTEMQAISIIRGDEWLKHPGSVGKPVLGEMAIFDGSGDPVSAGEVGEIYMKRPDGLPPTYRYVGAEPRELNGWESLGDLGWMDEDGYIYLSDRRTDLIVTGGTNVYPAEVEAAIESHPGVLSSCVVGLPDADLGHRVHAVVQADTNVTPDDIVRHVSTLLVRYKVPRSVEIVDEPLRDDAGKVRRSAVREASLARCGGD